MADTRADIPDRDVFKASEVCEIASVQPYGLRSGEQEFPSIGTSRSPGAPRVYRRADVELVLRIKELVFSEGLTLAGARRRIEDEDEPDVGAADTVVAGAETRERLAGIRRDLRALLDMLEVAPPATPAQGAWPPTAQGTLLEFGREPAARGEEAGPRKAAGGKKKGARPPKEG